MSCQILAQCVHFFPRKFYYKPTQKQLPESTCSLWIPDTDWACRYHLLAQSICHTSLFSAPLCWKGTEQSEQEDNRQTWHTPSLVQAAWHKEAPPWLAGGCQGAAIAWGVMNGLKGKSPCKTLSRESILHGWWLQIHLSKLQKLISNERS